MITRSFMLNLVPSAQEYLSQHFGLETQTLAKPQTSQAQNDQIQKMQTPTDSVNLELFQRSQELLLEVNFSLLANTKNIQLQLNSKETEAIATLSPLVLQALIASLKRSIPSIKWGIGFDF